MRVGLARELARARMDQLKASERIWLHGRNRAVPEARVAIRNSIRGARMRIDLSYEKYFGRKRRILVGGGFYKELKTYIYNQNEW